MNPKYLEYIYRNIKEKNSKKNSIFERPIIKRV